MNFFFVTISNKSVALKCPSVHPLFVAVALVFIVLFGSLLPVFAQGNNNPSGFALPRFVSVRADKTNVRVGPGTQYEVAWIFVKSGLPVEIIQEFDTWRKIRDMDGTEGWVHKSLLTGRRTAYIAPWDAAAEIPLRARNGAEARVRAWLTSKYLVSVDNCDGRYCEVSVQNPSSEGRASYSGFVEQTTLWGVYPNENFN
ncbi:MAG: SH3 domain-containing protein [Devosiaceae bacterium]|nr:SH3 domain-containing protein [Devosiaceae bacterium]